MSQERRVIPMDHGETLVELVRANVPLQTDVSLYVEHETGWWCAFADVAGERSHTVKIHQGVIDNDKVDWPQLLEQIRVKAEAEFSHPGGCVIKVYPGGEPLHPGGFRIQLDTPDAQPRKNPG